MAKKAKAGRLSPAIRQKALELTRYVRPKDWRGQVHALWEYVKTRVRYVRDTQGVETIHDAEQVLKQGAGDCDDKSILLSALLGSIDHPSRFVAVGFRHGVFSHVLPQTVIGNKWIWLETTEPVPMGWSPPRIVSRMVQNI